MEINVIYDPLRSCMVSHHSHASATDFRVRRGEGNHLKTLNRNAMEMNTQSESRCLRVRPEFAQIHHA